MEGGAFIAAGAFDLKVPRDTVILGHSDLQTTLGYMHVLSRLAAGGHKETRAGDTVPKCSQIGEGAEGREFGNPMKGHLVKFAEQGNTNGGRPMKRMPSGAEAQADFWRLFAARPRPCPDESDAKPVTVFREPH